MRSRVVPMRRTDSLLPRSSSPPGENKSVCPSALTSRRLRWPPALPAPSGRRRRAFPPRLACPGAVASSTPPFVRPVPSALADPVAGGCRRGGDRAPRSRSRVPLPGVRRGSVPCLPPPRRRGVVACGKKRPRVAVPPRALRGPFRKGAPERVPFGGFPAVRPSWPPSTRRLPGEGGRGGGGGVCVLGLSVPRRPPRPSVPRPPARPCVRARGPGSRRRPARGPSSRAPAPAVGGPRPPVGTPPPRALPPRRPAPPRALRPSSSGAGR